MTKSPWTVLGEKVAGVLIEAVDAGVAEAKRKAEAPPPNVVPIRPVDQAAEIELLKAEIARKDAANMALHREVERLNRLLNYRRRDLDEDLRTGRDAPSTEDDTTT